MAFASRRWHKMRKGLVCEIVGGEPYEYYPLGQHIVAAPGVCGGRPTFKYTRIDVCHVLSSLAAGESPEDIVADYQGRISLEAIEEAQRFAFQWAARSFNQPYIPQEEAA
jgi:uncharacterized protein (DUF433 family)